MEPALEITGAVRVYYRGEVFWAVNYIDNEGGSRCEIEHSKPDTPDIIDDYPSFLENSNRDDTYYGILQKINNEMVRIDKETNGDNSKVQQAIKEVETKKSKIIVACIRPDKEDEKYIKKVALVFYNRESQTFSAKLSDSRMQVSSLTLSEAKRFADNVYAILGTVNKLFWGEKQKNVSH